MVPDAEEIVTRVRATLAGLRASRIQPLINGTGILVHTNFGRAPLSADAIAAMSSIGSQYSNLEYSLTDGSRGGRAGYVERGLALLCGAEAATIVNNNAGALVLIVRHLCRPGADEVIISRGELVQIGGGFRIPEVLEASGARLCEVGTTNQTTAADYARAVTRRTALILKVHRSNFFMDGFVESPPMEDLADLGRRKRVPLVEDLGSGAMVETQAVSGLEHEPTPAEALRRGVDLVCFSGDKLFGGPQAGLIAGRQKLIAGLKREPLFRALRCDKLILAGLQVTIDHYLRGSRDLPLLDMLNAGADGLRARAASIVSALAGLPLAARIGEGRAQLGGGTLPRSAVSSVTVDLVHRSLKPQELAHRLRQQEIPVVGYITRGTFKLDLRTIFPQQDRDVIGALRAVCG
jgi:L-seryl-tRNA(Ser) seleniumtransferase